MNRVPFQNFQNIHTISKSIHDICVDHAYWRQRAKRELKIKTWHYNHNGISNVPLKRFYEFWIRKLERDCIFGPMNSITLPICLTKAIINRNVELMTRFRQEWNSKKFFKVILAGYAPYVTDIANHLRLTKDDAMELINVLSPVEYARLYNSKTGNTLTQLFDCMIGGDINNVVKLTHETCLYHVVIDILSRLVPSLDKPLSECMILLDRLWRCSPFNTALGLSFGAGYYSRRDIIAYLKRGAPYLPVSTVDSDNAFVPFLTIIGTLVAGHDIELFKELLPILSQEYSMSIFMTTYVMSTLEVSNFFVEVVRRYSDLKLELPYTIMNKIIGEKRIDILRVITKVGYEFDDVETTDIEFRSRLMEEGIIRT